MKKPPKWPTNPDGSPKKMRDLTPAQQMEQAEWAIGRLRDEGLNVTLVSSKAEGLKQD